LNRKLKAWDGADKITKVGVRPSRSRSQLGMWIEVQGRETIDFSTTGVYRD